MKGLEPPRLTTLDPKSNAATNYATCAVSLCKDSDFILFVQAVGTKKEATPSGITSFINSTPKDAMKLRMTGFECLPTSVIRLGYVSLPLRGWGPPSAD